MTLRAPSITLSVLYRIRRAFLRLTRPLTLGVRCIVARDDGHVLLVRHTYLPGWYLPGGGVERGESLEAAIAREPVGRGRRHAPPSGRSSSMRAPISGMEIRPRRPLCAAPLRDRAAPQFRDRRAGLHRSRCAAGGDDGPRPCGASRSGADAGRLRANGDWRRRKLTLEGERRDDRQMAGAGARGRWSSPRRQGPARRSPDRSASGATPAASSATCPSSAARGRLRRRRCGARHAPTSRR